MSTRTEEQTIYMRLRNEAEARLKAGTAAAYSEWSLGVDALQLLHRLSGDPGTADDAIKLLHELQVHQVELDLQNEEMHTNEQCLIDDCARYRELYESAPFGYFVVDFQGEIIDSNRAGAELFGVGQDELAGGRIDRFLTAESRAALLTLLKRLGEDGDTPACEVTVDGEATAFRSLRLVARVFPDRRCVLLACSECT